MFLFIVGIYMFFIYIKLEEGAIRPKGGKSATWWFGYGGGKY